MQRYLSSEQWRKRPNTLEEGVIPQEGHSLLYSDCGVFFVLTHLPQRRGGERMLGHLQLWEQEVENNKARPWRQRRSRFWTLQGSSAQWNSLPLLLSLLLQPGRVLWGPRERSSPTMGLTHQSLGVRALEIRPAPSYQEMKRPSMEVETAPAAQEAAPGCHDNKLFVWQTELSWFPHSTRVEGMLLTHRVPVGAPH